MTLPYGYDRWEPMDRDTWREINMTAKEVQAYRESQKNKQDQEELTAYADELNDE